MAEDERLPTAREALRRAVAWAAQREWEGAKVWTSIAHEIRRGTRERTSEPAHAEASAAPAARSDLREGPTEAVTERFRVPGFLDAPTEILIVGGAPQCAHCARPIARSGTHTGAPWVHVESPFQGAHQHCDALPDDCVATPRLAPATH